MSGMKWNRPKFRTQGRQTIDVREERLLLDQQATQLLRQQSEPSKKHRRREPGREMNRPHHCEPLSRAELASMIEQDVREIANDQFFNTPDAVRVEVDRRLAGVEESLKKSSR